MSREDSDMDSASEAASTSPERDSSKRKRKREDRPLDEIEVDVKAPEPPSKKALRNAKKGKPGRSVSGGQGEVVQNEHDAANLSSSKRSEYGVWVGNLPWNAGKPELTKFILDHAGILEADITRIHMPAPSKGNMDPSRQKFQPQNKGFAYVDFKTELACKAVISLSEKLLSGRRLLIKNSNSYEGRPDAKDKSEKKGNPPNKRIFVGNLTFDTTEDDLKEQFSKCGDVLSVFMATFEDSGQCKGYAWITFHDVDSAEKAVRGWVDWEQEDSDEDEAVKENRKAKKARKWWVNRLKGRSLRIEFAEDSSIRYHKRYGKNKDDTDAAARDPALVVEDVSKEPSQERSGSIKRDKPNGGQSKGLAPSFKPRIDARTIAPGAALTRAPRQSAAIVEAKGKKIAFE